MERHHHGCATNIAREGAGDGGAAISAAVTLAEGVVGDLHVVVIILKIKTLKYELQPVSTSCRKRPYL